jgi:serine/threonine protein kinase
MKAPGKLLSIEDTCELLRRSRLLAPAEVDDLEQRWQREARDTGNLLEFARWLVAGRYVTEYQMAMLLHGHIEHFFLDDYKLLERIGQGRLAMVYRAINRVGRVVALKVLPPSRGRDAQALARFQREARLGQRLDHPNVVRVLGAGAAHGLHYLVMEYLEGETLQKTLARRGRLPVPETIDVALQALAGLQHLHERGLVHRNIEPANLMLLAGAGSLRHRDGASLPVVKLLDISLCRAVGEEEILPEGVNRSRLSYEGLSLAVPGFVAPEMARDPHTADIRADLFSLGCVLYHALAGVPPFADTSPLRQMIRSATETTPPLDRVTPEVPAELADLVASLMARDRDQRCATPRQAADALNAYLTRASTVDVEPVAWGPSVVPPTAEPAGATVAPAVGEGAAFSTSAFVPVAAVAVPVERQAPAPSGRARDWLVLLLGACSLLFVQLLTYVLFYLFGAR